MLVISFKVIESTAFKKCSTGFLQYWKTMTQKLNAAEDKAHGVKRSKRKLEICKCNAYELEGRGRFNHKRYLSPYVKICLPISSDTIICKIMKCQLCFCFSIFLYFPFFKGKVLLSVHMSASKWKQPQKLGPTKDIWGECEKEKIESTLDSRFIKTADFVDSLARLSCTSETATINRVQEVLTRD